MRIMLLFLLSMMLPSVAGATIVDGLDVTALTRDADLIVVGTVTSIEIQGDTTVVLRGGREAAGRSRLATVSVDQVLKGSPASANTTFRFDLTTEFTAHRGVSEGDFQVLFLRGVDGEYRLVSPHWPGITAVPGAEGRGPDPLARVLNLLADGLRISTNSAVKVGILEAILGIDDPIAMDARNAVSGDPDPQVRLRALSQLLWSGQVEALPAAEAALTDRTLDPYLLALLHHGMEWGIRSEAAVPILERLLLFPEAETRRAAARTMRFIESPLIIEPLTLALDDSDFSVRLSAVQGLAREFGRSGEPTLIPGTEGFRNDEQRYIEPLRSRTSNPDR